MPNWNEMSYAQKCDALRDDIKRAFHAINVMTGQLQEVTSKLNEVAEAVVRLERGKK
jgi:hypothetical protein